ncbi:hypothetical protein K437DRAFT_293288 [Tilletiaria anomala UBC 951]|uniref:Uncharacterized protein n=1 Tax=Tilletiaria anomala (strain ATCC 24038 / CBS 436.72 / UBC 951) TaxID=1037660 RepID=A0A066WN53_TILAU|nr:uncharacterized protein K437DRAFT_293288 [Tilletiaria anomala UBC 951]KDN52060.1 hypothetical protein K437DRAFT_293288 [Tilletiaria anomala UBC 951]
MMSTIPDPVLVLSMDQVQKMDQLGLDQLADLWHVFTKCAEMLESGRRLENLSWRLWFREAHLVFDPSQAHSRAGSSFGSASALPSSMETSPLPTPHYGRSRAGSMSFGAAAAAAGAGAQRTTTTASAPAAANMNSGGIDSREKACANGFEDPESDADVTSLSGGEGGGASAEDEFEDVSDDEGDGDEARGQGDTFRPYASDVTADKNRGSKGKHNYSSSSTLSHSPHAAADNASASTATRLSPTASPDRGRASARARANEQTLPESSTAGLQAAQACQRAAPSLASCAAVAPLSDVHGGNIGGQRASSADTAATATAVADTPRRERERRGKDQSHSHRNHHQHQQQQRRRPVSFQAVIERLALPGTNVSTHADASSSGVGAASSSSATEAAGHARANGGAAHPCGKGCVATGAGETEREAFLRELRRPIPPLPAASRPPLSSDRRMAGESESTAASAGAAAKQQAQAHTSAPLQPQARTPRARSAEEGCCTCRSRGVGPGNRPGQGLVPTAPAPAFVSGSSATQAVEQEGEQQRSRMWSNRSADPIVQNTQVVIDAVALLPAPAPIASPAPTPATQETRRDPTDAARSADEEPAGVDVEDKRMEQEQREKVQMKATAEQASEPSAPAAVDDGAGAPEVSIEGKASTAAKALSGTNKAHANAHTHAHRVHTAGRLQGRSKSSLGLHRATAGGRSHRTLAHAHALTGHGHQQHQYAMQQSLAARHAREGSNASVSSNGSSNAGAIGAPPPPPPAIEKQRRASHGSVGSNLAMTRSDTVKSRSPAPAHTVVPQPTAAPAAAGALGQVQPPSRPSASPAKGQAATSPPTKATQAMSTAPKRKPVTFTMGGDESDEEAEGSQSSRSVGQRCAASSSAATAAVPAHTKKHVQLAPPSAAVNEEVTEDDEWSSDDSSEEDDAVKAAEAARLASRKREEDLFKKVPIRSKSAADMRTLQPQQSISTSSASPPLQPVRGMLSSLFHPGTEPSHSPPGQLAGRPHASAADLRNMGGMSSLRMSAVDRSATTSLTSAPPGKTTFERSAAATSHGAAAMHLPRTRSNLRNSSGFIGIGENTTLRTSKSAVALPLLNITSSKSTTSMAQAAAEAAMHTDTGSVSSLHHPSESGTSISFSTADGVLGSSYTSLRASRDGSSSGGGWRDSVALAKLNELAGSRGSSNGHSNNNINHSSRVNGRRQRSNEPRSHSHQRAGHHERDGPSPSSLLAHEHHEREHEEWSPQLQVVGSQPDMNRAWYDTSAAASAEDASAPSSSTATPRQMSAVHAHHHRLRAAAVPVELPEGAAPQTPRTTRRNMLRDELSESLRQNLLWERQSRNRMLGIIQVPMPPAKQLQPQPQQLSSSTSARASTPPVLRKETVLSGGGIRPLTSTRTHSETSAHMSRELSTSGSGSSRDGQQQQREAVRRSQSEWGGSFHHTGW